LAKNQLKLATNDASPARMHVVIPHTSNIIFFERHVRHQSRHEDAVKHWEMVFGSECPQHKSTNHGKNKTIHSAKRNEKKKKKK